MCDSRDLPLVTLTEFCALRDGELASATDTHCLFLDL